MMSSRPTQRIDLTAEEVLETIRHSNLHNVLVEGPDDVGWYSILFEKANIDWVPLSAGGRITLLNVFTSMTPEERASVVFIADRDIWYFSNIPTEYEDIVFTTGYSIENDVLKDSAGYGLLTAEEVSLVTSYKAVLCDWFAFCVDQLLKGGSPVVDVHPNQIAECDGKRVSWRSKYKMQIGYANPPESLLQRIHKEFELGFRGKCLANLYASIISRRDNRRNVKYSDSQLMDVSLRANPIDGLRLNLVNRVIEKISAMPQHTEQRQARFASATIQTSNGSCLPSAVFSGAKAN